VRLLVILAICACSHSVEAPEPPACAGWLDGAWDPRFAAPGIAGHSGASALVKFPDGRLIVGGRFAMAGELAARNIAAWDGRGWSALGAGLPPVRGLVVDDEQRLWAVAGETMAPGIVARWDPVAHAWIIVDTHAAGVEAIAAIDGGVVAFGEGGVRFYASSPPDDPGLTFVSMVQRTSVGLCAAGRSPMRDGIACWDGSAWSPFGSSLFGVKVMVRGNDGVWLAGGSFDFNLSTTEDARVWGLAALDTSGEWRPFAGGVQASGGFFRYASVVAIVPEEDGFVIAGDFVAVGSARARVDGIARWKHGRWRPVMLAAPHDRPGQLRALVADASGLHVAGTFYELGTGGASHVATIDHSGFVHPWARKDTLGITGSANSVVVRDGTLYLTGGIVTLASGRGEVARLDEGWEILGDIPSLDAPGPLALLPDGSPVVSGELVWRWTGTRWKQLTNAATYSSALFADREGALYFADPGVESRRSTIYRWRAGVLTHLGELPLGISHLGAFDGTLFAMRTNLDVTEVWRLDDDGWTALPRVRGSVLDMISSPAGLLLVSLRGLQRWNGEKWGFVTRDPIHSAAACAEGVIAVRGGAKLGQLVFYDDDATIVLGPPELDAQTALAPTERGVYVGASGGDGAALRRFGN
jgi:hypothetical protein